LAYVGVPGVHLKKHWYKALVHEGVAPDLLQYYSARVWVLSKEMEKNEEEKEEEDMEHLLLTCFGQIKLPQAPVMTLTNSLTTSAAILLQTITWPPLQVLQPQRWPMWSNPFKRHWPSYLTPTPQQMLQNIGNAVRKSACMNDEADVGAPVNPSASYAVEDLARQMRAEDEQSQRWSHGGQLRAAATAVRYTVGCQAGTAKSKKKGPTDIESVKPAVGLVSRLYVGTTTVSKVVSATR
jgi:hypothetical protein